MNTQPNPQGPPCPDLTPPLLAQARQQFEQALTFCLNSQCSFKGVENHLFTLLAALGCLLLRLFLTARHQRLDLDDHLQDGQYRRGEPYAERTLQTAHGPVRYGRAQLIRRKGGSGFYPLDAVLGLTRDRFHPGGRART